MNFLTSALWRMIPQKERQLLLSYAPQYQRRHIDRIFKGRAIYQPCFDRHRALFIHVPKSAGRSIVRGLFDVQSVEHAPAQWYQQLDPDKFERYFKFTVVRNPWDRVASAYSYLYQGGSKASAEDQLWSQFIKSFSSLDEFVCQWMTEENVLRNALFTPQLVYLTDMFGQMSMDFVARFENLEEDFQSIADRLNIDAALPHLNQSRARPYQASYTAESRSIVQRVYAKDIAQFEYQFETQAEPMKPEPG
jgi:chondroitin 4-sulfotransferase 11